MAISWLASSAESPFPPVEQATSHGLLAAGGDLSMERLLNAYRYGIFPGLMPMIRFYGGVLIREWCFIRIKSISVKA